MGQGIHTGLATIVAEELDANFESVRVVHGANGKFADGDLYGNPFSGGFQITGDSSSTGVYWQRYRPIPPKAPARLGAAAAADWQGRAPQTRVQLGDPWYPGT